MTTAAPLTRREAKALTRARLLDGALEILDAEGEAALTTTRVTRRAGIAQSSFYVHFTDVDDLLQQLVEDLTLQARRRTRAARRTARDARDDEESLRASFRVPLEDIVAHPRLFRLVLRSRHDRTSPLGAWSREQLETSRRLLVEDLAAAGLPHATEAERRRLEMLADGLIALTETLALGHLEGRYPDREQIVAALVAFCRSFVTAPVTIGHGSVAPGRTAG